MFVTHMAQSMEFDKKKNPEEWTNISTWTEFYINNQIIS